MDKSKYSKASKERWEKIDPEERSKRMRLLAVNRWSKATKAERTRAAQKMLDGRILKARRVKK